MIGRTNAVAGGGGKTEFKVVQGSTTLSGSNRNLVTIDFEPLMIVAHTTSYKAIMEGGSTQSQNVDGFQIKYRSNTSDSLSTLHMGTYGYYVTCNYDASSGAVTVGFEVGASSQSCTVKYIVLGV